MIGAMIYQTYTAFVRQKGYVTTTIVAIFFALFLWFLATISLGEAAIVMPLVSVYGIESIALLLLLGVVIQQIVREHEGGMVHLVMTKNPHVGGYVLGKFYGYSIVLAIVYGLLTLFVAGVMIISLQILPLLFVGAVLLSYIKIVVLVACALLFATLLRPLLFMAVIVIVYMVGHTAPAMVFFFQQSEMHMIWVWIARAIYYVMPPFADMSIIETVYSPMAGYLTWQHVTLLVGSLVLLLSLLLVGAVYAYKKYYLFAYHTK